MVASAADLAAGDAMTPMQFFDPPPLRWTGSKWRLADWLISMFPPHELYEDGAGTPLPLW